MAQESNRQEAYRARTRASLIKCAQEVLAKKGLKATIEDLAGYAQVSPATIYNHFGNKDSYIKVALNDLWQGWVLWAYDGTPEGVSFELMIDVCRKLFRVNRTHSLFGKVLNKTFNDSSFVIDSIRPTSEIAFKFAAEKSNLAISDFDTRLDMWSFCLAGIFHGVFVSKKLSPEDADNALRVSMAIWGFSPKRSEEIVARALNFA